MVLASTAETFPLSAKAVYHVCFYPPPNRPFFELINVLVYTFLIYPSRYPSIFTHFLHVFRLGFANQAVLPPSSRFAGGVRFLHS